MLLRVDKPLTRRVQEALLRLIRERNYQPGEKVPTEAELGQLFGVGRSTLREAIGNLVEQGILQKSHGRDFPKTAPYRSREWLGGADQCYRTHPKSRSKAFNAENPGGKDSR